jgi:ring-1,2-phenylacetyl-CoA epoxidase subunit PaaC
LVERDDQRDFARCIARLCVVITWRMAYFRRLTASPDPVLAAIAAKAMVEMTYHNEYAAGWLMRLGDGTDVSHERMTLAVSWAWRDLPELFEAAGGDEEFFAVLRPVLAAATIDEPPMPGVSETVGGRMGRHSDDFEPLLAQLQDFARANPEATW